MVGFASFKRCPRICWSLKLNIDEATSSHLAARKWRALRAVATRKCALGQAGDKTLDCSACRAFWVMDFSGFWWIFLMDFSDGFFWWVSDGFVSGSAVDWGLMLVKSWQKQPVSWWRFSPSPSLNSNPGWPWANHRIVSMFLTSFS